MKGFQMKCALCPVCLRLAKPLLCGLMLLLILPMQALTLKVASISVMGLKKTHNWVVLQEMAFQRGDTLSDQVLPALIEQSQQNIYNLGLFNQVTLKPLIVERDLHVIITVRERWYIWGAPILQIEERNSFDLLNALFDGNFKRVSGGLRLRWRNVTGRNETLTFSGQLGFSKRLILDYYWPSALRMAQIDLRLGGQYFNVKEIILGTEAGKVQWRGLDSEPFQRGHEAFFGAKKRFSLYTFLYGELGFKYHRFADSLYQFALNGENVRYIAGSTGRSYYPSLTIQGVHDRRDVRAYPLKGYKAQVFTRLSGGKGLSTTHFAKVGATWAHHLPLSRRWNLAYGVHQVWTWGDSIPYFEKSVVGISRREFMGLSSTMRGYEPYAIDGTFLHMSKAELKFALIPRQVLHFDYIPNPRFQDVPIGLYLTAFGDLGYVKDKSMSQQDQLFKNRMLYGYGIGLNLIGFYDILIRIEYSRNHLHQGGIYLHGSLQIK